MKAAKLDRKISIQHATINYSPSGEPIQAWEELAARRAIVFPVRGDERYGGEQWVAKEQVEFRIRWSAEVANVSPLDRIVYPLNDPATDKIIYDIVAVHEMGRHVGLRIIAARRADANA